MDIVEAIVEDLIEKVTMNPSRAAPANERAGLDTMLVDIESLMTRQEIEGLELGFTIGGEDYETSSEISQQTSDHGEMEEGKGGMETDTSSESSQQETSSETSQDGIDTSQMLEAKLDVEERHIELESVNLDVIEASVVCLEPGLFACSHPDCSNRRPSNRSNNIKLHIKYCHTPKEDRFFICAKCPDRFVTKHDLDRHDDICYGPESQRAGRKVGSHTKRRVPCEFEQRPSKQIKVPQSGPDTRLATKRNQEAAEREYIRVRYIRHPT